MLEYNYEDYIFVSSRINALSASLISFERMTEMAKARSAEELYRMLEESGVKAEKNQYGDMDFEEAVNKRLTDSFCSVIADVPQPELFSVFTYPYDCHNLKSLLKCAEKGISPERLIIPLGSVPTDKITESVAKRDFSVFPENMSKAAEAAREAYARTHNPQTIDLLIDAACFCDMEESVKENPLGFFSKILSIKADIANILTAIRLIRVPSVQSENIFGEAMVDGGGLRKDFFAAVFADEIKEKERALAEKLIYTEYEKLGRAMSVSEIRVSEAERICGQAYITELEKARETLTGAETVALYLAGIENEARNLRILLAGKRSGYGESEIIARLY